jgi:hypothetical protein
MLRDSLDCFSSSFVSYAAQDEEKQSTETGNIGYTRRRKTIQRNWQHRIHKTKKNNPEKLAT